jgi:hypothetical protein
LRGEPIITPLSLYQEVSLVAQSQRFDWRKEKERELGIAPRGMFAAMKEQDVRLKGEHKFTHWQVVCGLYCTEHYLLALPDGTCPLCRKVV